MSEVKTLGKIKLNNLGLLNTTLEMAIFDEVISLIFQKQPSELTSKQRKVGLLLIYDNEVLNGGHLQFFHNQGLENIEELFEALEETKAKCQKDILDKAFEYAQKFPVTPVQTLEEYHERAIEDEFFELDMLYYKCSPELGNELLPNYVKEHLNEFVEIE
jgi:Domain of unknown function (DUF4375)